MDNLIITAPSAAHRILLQPVAGKTTISSRIRLRPGRTDENGTAGILTLMTVELTQYRATCHTAD